MLDRVIVVVRGADNLVAPTKSYTLDTTSTVHEVKEKLNLAVQTGGATLERDSEGLLCFRINLFEQGTLSIKFENFSDLVAFYSCPVFELYLLDIFAFGFNNLIVQHYE